MKKSALIILTILITLGSVMLPHTQKPSEPSLPKFKTSDTAVTGCGASSLTIQPKRLSLQAQRDRLPLRLQRTYDAFYTKFRCFESFTVDLQTKSYSAEELDEIILAIKYDHPECWLYVTTDDSLHSQTYNGAPRFIEIVYRYTWLADSTSFCADTMRAYICKIDRVCDRILSGMPLKLTRAEKYLYLGKVLCDMAVYEDKSETDPQSPDLAYGYANGILLEGSGICQSYTMAYQWLCHRAGLPCVAVKSYAQKHIWNLVQLENGDTYHIDLTWCDEGSSEDFNDAWFLCSQSQIELDHILEPGEFYATGK